MPYIPIHERPEIDDELDMLKLTVNTSGQLNYAITKLVHYFLGDSPRYDDYNSVIGVLECAKLELYRRQVAIYEDQKIEENGDV